MKRRSISKVISILLAFCVAFSGLPFLAGSLDVKAASVTKKKITLKATVKGETKVKLKWNKVKSPGKGYAVFRDGKVIKRLSKKKTSFTDKGLKPGTKHKYQIKTYTKKKVTKWYNKKTKKWQKKKPAKKYRGKSKTVKVYVYKKKSNTVKVKVKSSDDDTKSSDSDESDTDTEKPSTDDTDTGDTEKHTDNGDAEKPSTDDTVNENTDKPSTGDTGNDDNEKPATDDAATSTADGTGDDATYTPAVDIYAPTSFSYTIDSDGYPKLRWRSVNGATEYKLYRTYNGSTVETSITTNSAIDTTAIQGLTYEYYVIALKDSSASPKSETILVPVPIRKIVTDYLGDVTTIYKSPTEDVWHYASNNCKVESMAEIDKTVDGEFETSSGHMVQYHGATFNATKIENALPKNYDYSVQMHNGDSSKFTIELESGMDIKPISTYKEVGNHKYEQTAKYYYFKNGHPIAQPRVTDGAFIYKTETSDSITTKHFLVINSAMAVGDALGIWAETFNVYVKYDGKLIGTITIDTARDEFLGSSWTSQTASGMSPWRRVALNIAEQAIAAKGGTTGSINRDLRLIEDYVEENYVYGEDVEVYGATMPMKCVAGAIILETYSIVHYNKFGFESSGSNYSSGTHSAFNLNEDPQTYYETQGRLN